VPPPKVTLTLSTPHDPATTPGAPRVSHAADIKLSAVVEDKNPIAEFEWDLGDGKGWQAGKLDPAGKQERAVTLSANGTPQTIRVRAKSAKSPHAEDAVQVVFAAIAEAKLDLPPLTITNATLALTGSFKLPDPLRSTVHVRVTS